MTLISSMKAADSSLPLSLSRDWTITVASAVYTGS
jgi:hypothetical protein